MVEQGFRSAEAAEPPDGIDLEMTRIGIKGLLIAAAVSIAPLCLGWTKAGRSYTTDGTLSDVESAIANATDGDRVNLPAGSFTWGDSGAFLTVNKRITLAGAGDATTVTISTGGGEWTSGTIRVSAAATIRDFKIEGASDLNRRTPFSMSSNSGWRVTNVDYSQNGTGGGYYAYIGGVYGVFDSFTITSNSGSSEFFFSRGPTDSWQTDDSFGTADAVYIEDVTLQGSGALTDANSNGRMVVRFCTLVNGHKIDGHGFASNSSPVRGFRHIEVYNNTWQNDGSFQAIYIRGGTARVFDNTLDAATNTASIRLTERGTAQLWTNFGNTYQTPDEYPIADQVGAGKDVTIDATSIATGIFYRIDTVGTTDFTTVGAGSNAVGVQFQATGTPSGNGTVDYAPAATEPVYVWGNDYNTTTQWALTWDTVPAEAHTEYGQSFTMEDDIIVADREYFEETAGFDGTTGMGIGTRSAMDAITPTTTGVGFWVTDEGDWNANEAGADGRLYVWDGSAWALDYTPYNYPHPLRRDSIATATTATATTFNIAADLGGGGFYEFAERFEGTELDSQAISGYDNSAWTSDDNGNDPNWDAVDDPAAPLAGSYSLWLQNSAVREIYRGFTVSGNTVWVAGKVHYSETNGFLQHSLQVQESDGTAIAGFMIRTGSYDDVRVSHGTVQDDETVSNPAPDGVDLYFWLEVVEGTGSDGIARIYLSETTTRGAADAEVTTGDNTGTIGRVQLIGSSGAIWDDIIFDSDAIGDNPWANL